MKIAILNEEGLTIPGVVEILPIFEYEMFKDVPDEDLQHYGLILSLDTFFEKKELCVQDSDGQHLSTPCPSYKGWLKVVDVALKDFASRTQSVPEQIWLPGSVRPVICQVGDDEPSYYYACYCSKCNSEEDLAIIDDFLQTIAEEGAPLENPVSLADDNIFSILKKRSKRIAAFDKRMAAVVKKYFPKCRVTFFIPTRHESDYESFCLGKRSDYALYPHILPADYNGELLLDRVEDFQLATLFTDASSAILKLPPPMKGEYSEYDGKGDFFSAAMDLFGQMSDIRTVAERYMKATFEEAVHE